METKGSGRDFAGLEFFFDSGFPTTFSVDSSTQPQSKWWNSRTTRSVRATFLRELQQAELDCESALVKKWHDAAPDDWRAARDLLARRFRDRWGREVELVVTKLPGQSIDARVAI
jgi:hypothetical protein